jgi:hypothetical protein
VSWIGREQLRDGVLRLCSNWSLSSLYILNEPPWNLDYINNNIVQCQSWVKIEDINRENRIHDQNGVKRGASLSKEHPMGIIVGRERGFSH